MLAFNPLSNEFNVIKPIPPNEASVTEAAGAATIDFSKSSGATNVIMAGANITFTFQNAQAGGSYLLRITQDATGSWTYTWPAAVKWPGGVSPLASGANKTDFASFYYDGANYWGTFSGNY